MSRWRRWWSAAARNRLWSIWILRVRSLRNRALSRVRFIRSRAKLRLVERDAGLSSELLVVAELKLIARADASPTLAAQDLGLDRQQVRSRCAEADEIVVHGGFDGVEGEQRRHAFTRLFDAQNSRGLLIDPDRSFDRRIVQLRGRFDPPTRKFASDLE